MQTLAVTYFSVSLISKIKEVFLPFSRRGRHGRKKSNSLPWLDYACLKLMKHRDNII
jgi:hypothetical protein